MNQTYYQSDFVTTDRQVTETETPVKGREGIYVNQNG
jgi:hypothetical protein